MKMLEAWVAVIAVVSSACAQPSLERGWTLVREDLDVFVDPGAGSVRVEGSLVAKFEHGEASSGPVLAVNTRSRLMEFVSVRCPGAAVEVNAPHPEIECALLSRVVFAEPKRPGDEVSVSFVCRSVAQGRQLVAHETVALASWVEGWYPILPPREGASLGGASKVAGRTTFHLPAGWRAVTNGGLVSTEESGAGVVEVWETERALSRSFAAGPYKVMHERVGGLGVSLYLLSDNLPNPRAHVESLASAMRAMEARWGGYPYPSYAIAEVPMDAGDFGASSEQGFIMVKPSFLQVPAGNLPLFAHEAAHGWWGNTVGTDGPGELLCSESLAQYGAVIAAEAVWGEEGATEFLRFSRPGYIVSQCAMGYFELVRQGQDKPLAELLSGGGVDHTLSDAKGHWVYHMLRRRVGDGVFFATLRGLIERFAGRVMTLDDVRAAFVAAAPDAGLGRFFEQWLDREGAPVLTNSWEADAGGVSVTVRQMQEGAPFELSLDVLLEDAAGGRRVERVNLDKREQVFRFAAEGEVTRVELDPAHALLVWEPEYGPAPVSGLGEIEPDAIDARLVARCAGEYAVQGAGIRVSVRGDGGAMWISAAGEPERRLVQTGGTRFVNGEGFVVFDPSAEPPGWLLFFRNQGGVARAVRVP